MYACSTIHVEQLTPALISGLLADGGVVSTFVLIGNRVGKRYEGITSTAAHSTKLNPSGRLVESRPVNVVHPKQSSKDK